MKEKTLSVKQKINLIEKSSRLENISLSALPAVHNSEYYFVSYSHLDYKAVYKDMLLLQDCGVNLWYDRGLPAGRDWEEMAEEALSKHACAGVIFYLSVNALRSDAILTEIKKVRSLNKDFLAIMLPTGDSGAVLSPQETLKLSCENFDEDEEKVAVVREAFGEKIIYLSIDADALQKAEKIHGLRRPNLYEIADNGTIGTLLGVNNNKIIRAELPFQYENGKGNVLPVRAVGEVAFANFKSLKAVNFPAVTGRPSSDEERFFTVKDLAFYKCGNLEDINFNNNDLKIENKAFSGCVGLKKLSFAGAKEVHIGVESFYGCSNLEEITINTRIEAIAHNAFGGCGIERIYGPDEDSDCDYYVCDNCIYNFVGFLVVGSANAVIPKGSFIGAQIMPYAFSGNTRLKRFDVPAQTKKIQKFAFVNTENLIEVTFAKGLEVIEEYAFHNSGIEILKWSCDEPVAAGSTVKIEKNAFKASALKKIDFTGVNVSLADLAFLNCYDLKEVVFDAEQEIICADGANPFAGCKCVEKVSLPKKLAGFSKELFRGSAIKNLSGPKAEENSEYFVEGNCLIHEGEVVLGGAECKLSDGVEKIGNRAFYGNSLLKEIMIPDKVTEIGVGAFSKSGLERAVIGKGVSAINECAFEDSCLKSIEFMPSTSPLVIGRNAFCGCKVEELSLPDRVTSVDKDAFYFCQNLKRLRLGKDFQVSGRLRFTCCDQLEELVFGVTRADLAKILNMTDLYESKGVRKIKITCADCEFYI